MSEISLDLLNKSDVDGNTPLHLSVIYKCYSILFLPLRTKLVDKHDMNHNHYTAAELFYSQKQEISFRVAMSYYTLQRYYKKPSQQQNIRGKEEARKGRPENDCAIYEVHLLVAVLLATVGFAAAFQMFLDFQHNRLLLLCNHSLFLVLWFERWLSRPV